MSNVFTLESLVEEVEREYAPLTIEAGDETFVLKSLFRCDKKVRDAVIDKLTELEGLYEQEDKKNSLNEDETLEAIAFVISNVTADRKGPKLVKLLKGDLMVSMTLLRKWREATQPGEATDSPN